MLLEILVNLELLVVLLDLRYQYYLLHLELLELLDDHLLLELLVMLLEILVNLELLVVL
jgi:hypothetical protein